jgi:hypothetical protein
VSNRKGKPMTDETQKSKSSWWAVVLVLLLPVLYVLSIGPVVRIVDRTGSKTAKAAVADFYAPLGWLHKNTSANGLIDRYLDLWR